MKPSVALDNNREAVRAAVDRNRAANPRVFGSVPHGEDGENSDIDILVDALPGATLFDLGGLQVELENLLGVKVDLVTPLELPHQFRERGSGGGAVDMKAYGLRILLEQMLEAAHRATSFIDGMEKAHFLEDIRTE